MPTKKSPFPGMDPFLEDGAEWGGVHTWLMTTIGEQLGRLLPANFSIKIEQRVYLTADGSDETQQIVPDVYVIRNPSPVLVEATKPGMITPAALVETLHEVEIHDRYLEIRDKQNRQVITTIEILSPFNKTPGTPGRTAFMEKRRAVTHSDTHWVEIDLLRAGERPEVLAGKSDYYALLKRGGAFGPFEVWYFDLRDRMPTIAIPLRAPHADLPLDLQAALDDVYQRGRYANDIDYTAPVPLPRLRPADKNWVAAHIAAWQADSVAP
jgi:hypothetical protein